MAVPTNLYQKASLKGDREDLIDKIYNTSPTETPVLSAVGRVSATNTYHEWQRDALATANKDNALIDGGQLVTPFADRTASPRGYLLVVEPAARLRPAVRALERWLLDEAAGLPPPSP